MDLLDFNLLLNIFSLIKIPGYIDPGSATAVMLRPHYRIFKDSKKHAKTKSL